MIQYYNVVIFPACFGITTSLKTYKKELKRIGLEDAPALGEFTAARACCTRFDGSLVNLIFINPETVKDKPVSEIIGILAHEVAHVKQFIFEEFGEEKAPETEGYLIQYIMTCCLNAIAEGA